MGQKRMFSLCVVDTDKFTEMPCSAQALYFHLGMHGDDDGFVSSPMKIQRSVGCSADDLRLLAAKGFIIPFESGVIVITDWGINNTLKNDRYHSTVYKTEKAMLQIENSGRYALSKAPLDPECFQLGSNLDPKRIQTGSNVDPQHNITKHNITKPNKTKPNKTNTSYFCTEPKNDSTPPAITLPLNTGEEYPISGEMLVELSGLYPAVDVMQQLRNMRGWLLANLDKRKTKRGINRFVANWLSRVQDRGGQGTMPTASRGSVVSTEPSILDELPL